MSGSRCKMLRAAFTATHGRAPRKTTYQRVKQRIGLGRLITWLKPVEWETNEWRPLKRVWMLRLRRGLA